MAEWFIGPVSTFEDEDQRVIVSLAGAEVVVFRHNGRFFGLQNTCLHMGGPVGEGLLIGRVEAVLADDQRVIEERFSETEMHLVCPWHGWEYDIESGACAGDRRRKLATYPIVVRDGGVYVVGR